MPPHPASLHSSWWRSLCQCTHRRAAIGHYQEPILTAGALFALDISSEALCPQVLPPNGRPDHWLRWWTWKPLDSRWQGHHDIKGITSDPIKPAFPQSESHQSSVTPSDSPPASKATPLIQKHVPTSILMKGPAVSCALFCFVERCLETATERWHHQAPTQLGLNYGLPHSRSCPGTARKWRIYGSEEMCVSSQSAAQRDGESREESVLKISILLWNSPGGEELPLSKQALKLHHSPESNPLQDLLFEPQNTFGC